MTNIIRVEQYHLALKQLQWRSSGTTSSVFYMTAVCKYTLTYVHTRGFSPLFSLEFLLLTCQTGSVGVSDRRPVKDSDNATLRQVEIPYRHTSERILGTLLTPVRAYLAINCLL